MGALKKPTYSIQAGDSKMEQEARKFNKRALIGSIVIHLFFFLLKLPHLELTHKLHDDPKLIPIKMELVTPPAKSTMIRNKVKAAESEVIKPVAPEQKVKNGTERVEKKADRIGDRLQNKVQDVQKGDPRSKNKTAFKPGTDLRKLPKTDVGTGSAKGKVQATDGNTGGSGDTYKGTDMTNLTDSLLKKGQGLKRLKTNRNAVDDGGAGGGTGGGMGDGVGGGNGDGHFTGTTTGTTNLAKVATNVGSLTGAAKGRIDSSKGFDGLAQKGSVMVAGVPVEKIAVATIDPDAIKRLLREHIPQFRYCYQKELDVSDKPEGFQGVMSFRFFIGTDGKVQRSSITSEEITSDKVRGCMKNVLHGIQFPTPRGGRTVEVNQPMNLYPKRI
ncbi:MAG: AgmX/PglI C-terminal domain-containing protein [Bacteriovorax sp.]|nr:AgmX/PglI C-terminal domain-containing protein [Bacteriovorax sp.]